MKYKGQDHLLLVKALNEFDSKSSGSDKLLTPHIHGHHCRADILDSH